jgi:arylsulfatase
LANYDPATMPPPLFRPEDFDHQLRFANIRAQNTIARNPLDTRLPDSDASSSPDTKAGSSFNGRLLKCGYYAMVEMLDWHFGELLGALEERGELDNKIVIFQSDHGELLGDHGLVYKGARFFDGIVRVPLVIRWPERFDGGRRVDGLTELIDVAPTLLEAAGREVPDAMQGAAR